MSADAMARVRRWLRGTVPGDLARVVGDPAAAVRADDVAAVLDALAAQTERADAAEGECARLRGERDG